MNGSEILDYLLENANKLFKTSETNVAVFDRRGFYLSDETATIYNPLKNKPHLYLAFGNNYYYAGKSNQVGGRWKRGHAYHLGELTHEILNTKNSYDHNHSHWIVAWMRSETLQNNQDQFSIQLRDNIQIAFITFDLYAPELNETNLTKENIKKINTIKERELIDECKLRNFNLLNIQNAN